MAKQSMIGLRTLEDLRLYLKTGEKRETVYNVDVLIQKAAIGTGVSINTVKTRIMSPDDLADLQKGEMTVDTLANFIKLWLEQNSKNWNDL